MEQTPTKNPCKKSSKAEMVLIAIMQHLYHDGELNAAARIGALIEELRDENDSKIAKRSRT